MTDHRATQTRGRAAGRTIRVAVLLAACSSIVGLTACIQQKIVFEPFSVVAVQVVTTPDWNRAGIRVAISGTGTIAGDNDHAFTDSSGFASIRTQATGRRFVVARHQDYDIAVGGTAANLALSDPPDPWQAFRAGRLDIPSVGVAVSPDFLFPWTGAEFHPAQRAPRQVGLRKKVPGKARFQFILEDSHVLTQTMAPTKKPEAYGFVYVTGDWNNFSFDTEVGDPVNGARSLYDDGSFQHPEGGDDNAKDGVFTRILDLPPGEHTYMYLVNGVALYIRDPYEELSKNVRVVARIPKGNPGNPNMIDVREFRASCVLVTKPE